MMYFIFKRQEEVLFSVLYLVVLNCWDKILGCLAILNRHKKSIELRIGLVFSFYAPIRWTNLTFEFNYFLGGKIIWDFKNFNYRISLNKVRGHYIFWPLQVGRLIKGGHYSRGDTIFHPLFSYGETNQKNKLNKQHLS